MAAASPDENAPRTNSTSPTAALGKATVAPAQLTNDGVEMKNIASGSEELRPPLPLEQDIMQLARLGEVGAMQKLFEMKTYNAKYKDAEGITPLHVRSCRHVFSVEKGEASFAN
jgi:palmitoyltransferase